MKNITNKEEDHKRSLNKKRKLDDQTKNDEEKDSKKRMMDEGLF